MYGAARSRAIRPAAAAEEAPRPSLLYQSHARSEPPDTQVSNIAQSILSELDRAPE